MARYILIDNASGYIFSDTADIEGRALSLGTNDDDIIAACRATDRSIGQPGYVYEITGSLASNDDGYLVYRADVRGSEQVAVITDGQDQEQIDAVSNHCDFVAYVRVSWPDEALAEHP